MCGCVCGEGCSVCSMRFSVSVWWGVCVWVGGCSEVISCSGGVCARGWMGIDVDVCV